LFLLKNVHEIVEKITTESRKKENDYKFYSLIENNGSATARRGGVEIEISQICQCRTTDDKIKRRNNVK